MPSRLRPQVLAYVACALLVAVIGWRALHQDAGGVEGDRQSAPALSTVAESQPSAGGARSAAGAIDAGARGAVEATSGTADGGPAGGEALVHVVGAVRHPGVYRLPVGARVQDAIRKAGGAGARAELAGVNLAARVTDAQQIVVPRRGARAATPGPAEPGPAGSVAPSTAAPIDLNTATAEQLETLDGVGPVTAGKILEFRTRSGRFASVDELEQVPGIGPKRLEALRARVRV